MQVSIESKSTKNIIYSLNLLSRAFFASLFQAEGPGRPGPSEIRIPVSQTVPLLRFFVHNRRPAPFAVFFELQLLRLLFLVDRRRVVASFALSADQSHNVRHGITPLSLILR
jgi:hypothetical protein